MLKIIVRSSELLLIWERDKTEKRRKTAEHNRISALIFQQKPLKNGNDSSQWKYFECTT